MKRKGCKWKKTTDPLLKKHPDLLASDKDYEGSNCNIYCYKNETTGNLMNWDGTTPCNDVKVAIHRGHLIAASYGKGNSQPDGVKSTFTLTNAVPQIGAFNSGQWMQAEKGMMTFAQNCEKDAVKKNLNAKIYVVVGIVPSSFLGKPRYT